MAKFIYNDDIDTDFLYSNDDTSDVLPPLIALKWGPPAR